MGFVVVVIVSRAGRVWCVGGSCRWGVVVEVRAEC